MVEYTPGALNALFNNSASNDKSEKSSKGSGNLIELFSKKNKVKNSLQKSKVNGEDASKTPIGKTEPNYKPNKLANAAKFKNIDSPKDQVKVAVPNIIGPTVIPSKENLHSSSKRLKNAKRKKYNEEIEGEDGVLEGPTYSGPSLKYKVIEEDKKAPKFDEEKEGRTVFVGNLPNTITGKILKRKVSTLSNNSSVRTKF